METRALFPALPVELQERFKTPALALRIFGSRIEDIQIDFQHAPRPQLITRILQGCSEPHVDEELFWELEVSQRTAALLQLVILGGKKSWSVPLRCPQKDCGQRMEVELTANDFPPAEARQKPLGIEVRGTTWYFKRPKGRDQRQWQQKHYPDMHAAVTEIIRTLRMNSDHPTEPAVEALGTEELEKIEQSMENHDPWQRLQFESQCPQCNQSGVHGVDLESMALRSLQEKQQRILYEIHCMAKTYHWSEADIFALPEWRRQQYLAWIERES